jgi:hypothetical protein
MSIIQERRHKKKKMKISYNVAFSWTAAQRQVKSSQVKSRSKDTQRYRESNRQRVTGLQQKIHH